jgi:hypothetical protein
VKCTVTAENDHVKAEDKTKITAAETRFMKRTTKYEGSLKVRGLTLLLRIGTLWRCSDDLFFEVSPLASDALSYNAPPTSRKRERSDKVSPRTLLTALVVVPPS